MADLETLQAHKTALEQRQRQVVQMETAVDSAKKDVAAFEAALTEMGFDVKQPLAPQLSAKEEELDGLIANLAGVFADVQARLSPAGS